MPFSGAGTCNWLRAAQSGILGRGGKTLSYSERRLLAGRKAVQAVKQG